MDFEKHDPPPPSSDNAVEDCIMCHKIRMITEGGANRCDQDCIYRRYFDDVDSFEMMLQHYDIKLLTAILMHKHATDPQGLPLWIQSKIVDLRAILNMPSASLPTSNPSPGPSDSNTPLPSPSADMNVPSSQDPSSLPTSHPSNMNVPSSQDPSSLPTSNPSASCPPDSSTPLPSGSLSPAISPIAHRLRPRKTVPLPVPGTSKVSRRKKKRVPATASISTFQDPYPPPASNSPSHLGSSSRMLISSFLHGLIRISSSPHALIRISSSPHALTFTLRIPFRHALITLGSAKISSSPHALTFTLRIPFRHALITLGSAKNWKNCSSSESRYSAQKEGQSSLSSELQLHQPRCLCLKDKNEVPPTSAKRQKQKRSSPNLSKVKAVNEVKLSKKKARS